MQAEGVELIAGEEGISAAQIAARKAIAKQAYKDAGFDDNLAKDHMRGIDFAKPVSKESLNPGKIVEQKQTPGSPQGNYYSEPGTPANKLGISDNAIDDETGELLPRQAKLYKLRKETTILKSTAAEVVDNFSNPANPIKVPGGGTQYFSPDKSAFEEMNND